MFRKISLKAAGDVSRYRISGKSMEQFQKDSVTVIAIFCSLNNNCTNMIVMCVWL